MVIFQLCIPKKKRKERGEKKKGGGQLGCIKANMQCCSAQPER